MQAGPGQSQTEPDGRLLAACERGATRALERTAHAIDEQKGDAPAAIVLEAGMHAALSCVRDDPTLARRCLVDVLSLGPQGLAQRDALLNGFVDLLDATLDDVIDRPRPPMAAEMVVGGVVEVVQSELRAGRAERLPSLAGPLTGLWLTGLIAD